MQNVSPSLMAAAFPGSDKKSDIRPFKVTFKHPVQDEWSKTRYCTLNELLKTHETLKLVGLVYRIDFLGKIITNQ